MGEGRRKEEKGKEEMHWGRTVAARAGAADELHVSRGPADQFRGWVCPVREAQSGLWVGEEGAARVGPRSGGDKANGARKRWAAAAR
jgi:hypothetical protein